VTETTTEATPAGSTVGGSDESTTSSPAKRRGSGLNGMLLSELKQMAGGLGIKGLGGMRKSQLVDAIKASQSGSQAGDSPSVAAESAGDQKINSKKTADSPDNSSERDQDGSSGGSSESNPDRAGNDGNRDRGDAGKNKDRGDQQGGDRNQGDNRNQGSQGGERNRNQGDNRPRPGRQPGRRWRQQQQQQPQQP